MGWFTFKCFLALFNMILTCNLKKGEGYLLIIRTDLSIVPSKVQVSHNISEPVHEISNNMVCATSKASDQPARTHSLIRAFASRLSIL